MWYNLPKGESDLNITIKVPMCNIIACEDIKLDDNNKMCILSPFTAISGGLVKRFYTYTVIQGILNGATIFKIQLLNQSGKVIQETEESRVYVEENIIRAKTKWQNVQFNKNSEYVLQVMIKCNNDYDVVGCSSICIV